MEPITTIYRNAVVFTGETTRPTAEALAVSGTRILAVGDLDAVRSAAGPGCPEVDLEGSFLTPGIAEGHGHMIHFGQSLDKVQLRDCRTVEDVRQRLRLAREASPDATRILGVGWRFDIFDEGEQPTATMLDEAVPGIPVLLDANDLHTVWANTAALAAMGIDSGTPDPVGGEIVRDERGEATGFLIETAAVKHAWGYIEETTSDEDRDRFLDNAFSAYLEAGVTSATDMALGEKDLEAILRRIDRDGRLPFPLTAHWMLTATGEAEKDLDQVSRAAAIRDERVDAPGAGWFRLAGVKFVLDGVIDACTAAMRDPYVNGELPAPIWSPGLARKAAVAADAAGLQLALHAIGDSASEIALDIVEECIRVNGPRPDRRPRIEHLESVTNRTILRMAALGAVASMQPVHCDPAIMDNWQEVLGPERGEAGFPWHTFRERGVSLALGTDAPTAPYRALENLFIAVTARSALDHSRRPYHPERVFSPAEAIAAMTAGTAYAAQQDGEFGRLAGGYRANLTVWDVNPLSDPAEQILAGRVLRTFVDGEEVYRHP